MNNEEFEKLEKEYIKILDENPLDKETMLKLIKIYAGQKMFFSAEALWIGYLDSFKKIPKSQIDAQVEADFEREFTEVILEAQRLKNKESNDKTKEER